MTPLEGVNRDSDDPRASTHAPELTLKEGHEEDWLLEIDLSNHSETPDHHTAWIELEADGTPVGSLRVDPEVFGGRVQVSLGEAPAPETVVVRARCNLHGVWESELRLD